MKGKLGITFMCLGTVLLIMALSLFLYNNQESLEAQQVSIDVMPQIIQQIETAPTETKPIVIPGTPVELIDPAALEMTEVEIDGHLYIGYLAIPDLGLELPIMSGWDYQKLRIAPCRYTGNLLSDDLVLMAHNYATHFGKIKNLSAGSAIYFTDMDGKTTQYEVVATEVLAPTAVEDMTVGEFDLTLFTCTYGGKSRVTVRCDRHTAE